MGFSFGVSGGERAGRGSESAISLQFFLLLCKHKNRNRAAPGRRSVDFFGVFLKGRVGMVRPCAEFAGEAGGHDTEGNLMGGKKGLNQGAPSSWDLRQNRTVNCITKKTEINPTDPHVCFLPGCVGFSWLARLCLTMSWTSVRGSPRPQHIRRWSLFNCLRLVWTKNFSSLDS